MVFIVSLEVEFVGNGTKNGPILGRTIRDTEGQLEFERLLELLKEVKSLYSSEGH